ncbi:MAG: WecB/TagA/CpsF family glycosyltransferase [Clostridiaceae bacterium]|nr:WecB/TagA/CpsF family glycosyltransferase [Clostridiaceae bacterium]
MVFIRTDILSVEFDNLTLGEAVDIAMENMIDGTKCRVVTPNAEIGLDCIKNDSLRRLVNDSQLVLPDGIGVVYASRILKRPIKQKVAGFEFADALANRLQNTGKKLFLFGGKPGIADEAAKKLCEKYPGLEIAGTENGYYDDENKIIEKINSSGADALFVCLGCPKQEFFMQRNREILNVSLMAGLGGSLDVFSGNSQRAPKLFIDLGLEWFYRLIKEPKRIKRMARLPLYLVYAAASKDKGEKNNA